MLKIIQSGLLKKQGLLWKSIDLAMAAHSELKAYESSTSSNSFKKLTSAPITNLLDTLLLNAAKTCIHLRLPEKSICLINSCIISSENTFMSNYHKACLQFLKSCALFFQGTFHESLGHAIFAMTILQNTVAPKHSILAVVYNLLGVLLAIAEDFQSALDNLQQALTIVKDTSGSESIFFKLIQFNEVLIKKISKLYSKSEQINVCSSKIVNYLPECHPMRKRLDIDIVNQKVACFSCGIQSENAKIIWDLCFVSLLDHPLAWVDYAPCIKSIVIGADYQVWAHVKKIIHQQPFKYSWIGNPFLGSFHKLADLHEKLVKRFGKFHLEKHKAAFLDNPSISKVQYLLSMKDFDTSNQFFYHDVLAGICELVLAVIRNVGDFGDMEDSNLSFETNLLNTSQLYYW